MEKLYNNARDRHVTIYCRRYNRIYMPKAVFNNFQDKNESEIQAVDVYIDTKMIKIVPNSTGEFNLCHNGTSPNGRSVCLNRTAIDHYGVTEGHYPCEVDADGTLVIKLERLEKC